MASGTGREFERGAGAADPLGSIARAPAAPQSFKSGNRSNGFSWRIAAFYAAFFGFSGIIMPFFPAWLQAKSRSKKVRIQEQRVGPEYLLLRRGKRQRGRGALPTCPHWPRVGPALPRTRPNSAHQQSGSQHRRDLSFHGRPPVPNTRTLDAKIPLELQ